MQLNWDDYAFLFDWELYAINSHQTSDYKAWLKLCKRFPGKVLEIGCGSGRISSKLAQNNIDISALDKSPLLIKKMKSNHPNFPKEKIFLGDMTSYILPQKYDFVFYSYSTFQYLLELEDQIKALMHINKFMNPKAYIAFDICPYTCDLPQEQQKVLLYKKYHKELKKEISMFTSHTVDRLRQITNWYDSYVLEDETGNRQVIHHHLALKGIRIEFLHLLLHHCGFKLLDIYGDFDLNEVKADSDNLIILGQKL